MSQALQNIDWDLLHRQKCVLVRIWTNVAEKSPEFEALSGIIHLLDALQDEAVDQGRWTVPNETKGDLS